MSRNGSYRIRPKPLSITNDEFSHFLGPPTLSPAKPQVQILTQSILHSYSIDPVEEPPLEVTLEENET